MRDLPSIQVKDSLSNFHKVYLYTGFVYTMYMCLEGVLDTKVGKMELSLLSKERKSINQTVVLLLCAIFLHPF